MSAPDPASAAQPGGTAAAWPGHCLCGHVRYELTAPPLTCYACHCTDCQRRTGGAMRLVMWVHRSAVQVTLGTPVLLEFDGAGGRPRRSRACARCDTRLWAEPPNQPELAMLFPGTLENPRAFEPVAHLWLRSALPWTLIPPGAVRYDTQPEDPHELIRLWRAARAADRLP
ncbi:GFA family protein [Ideonella sp. DXS29W]|uniref:GFA family protein n=1 Tax=Ideonella lacteola TaxID=2984193 RepID=A0ABU9BKN2_9BURK